MSVGLGLVALAFGGLWWAEIIERDRLDVARRAWSRHQRTLCAWSGRVGIADPDVQWIECPGCGTAFAGDDDLTLPDHTEMTL